MRIASLILILLLLVAPARAETRLRPQGPQTPTLWRGSLLATSYVGLYAGATKVGSRFGLERRFRVVRLESAYAYDLLGHVYATKELGGLLERLNRWAGLSPSASRNLGVWGGAFGALTYMEVINGFMPGVRFDPLDPAANALGAWLATGASGLPQRYPILQRFSLQFGYKDWGRVFGPEQSSGVAGNVWHDYPNGRFGLGFDVGPQEREWVTLHLAYEITSFDLDQLRNRFALGVELRPVSWLRPWLERLPGGRSLVAFHRWWNERLILPGLYVELAAVATGLFTGREPFAE